MGLAISFLSGKGGVGKTTVCANVAALTAQKGKRVVIADLDIGLKNMDIILGLENRVVYDVCDVICGRCSLTSALVSDKRSEGLYLLAASQTKTAEQFCADDINDVICELKKKFDFVFIDGPAGVGRGFENALLCSDYTVVVTTPDVSAVRDADRVCGLIQSHGIENLGVVVNRVRKRMVMKNNMLSGEDIASILSENLLGSICEDKRITIATNRGDVSVKKARAKIVNQYKAFASKIAAVEKKPSPMGEAGQMI